MTTALLSLAFTLLFAGRADEPAERRVFTAEDVFALEYASDPRVSPDGSVVAYVRMSMERASDRPRGAIWTIDTRSGAQRPLVTGPGSYRSPRWSPAGDRLLYVASEADGEPELRVRFMDGGTSFRVAELFEAPTDAVWSPDGQTIAFAMFTPAEPPSLADPPAAPEAAEWAEPVRVFDDLVFRFDGEGWLEEGATHVYVVPAEGGTPRDLTPGEADFDSPVWLDARTLAVVGNDDDAPELDPIESDIFALDVRGESELRPLTERDGPDEDPAVSPDGALVAYTGYDDELLAYQQTDVWVMRADGSQPRNLTAGYDRDLRSPAWRGDGRAVYALASDGGETALVQIGLDGEVRPTVRDVGGLSIGRPYGSGAFTVSATGDVVAYTQQRWNRPADVALLAGAALRRLTDLNEDALGHVELAELEEIRVASSHDERPIEAWIAKPPGFVPGGAYPMILEIHGGPFAMYGPSFSAEIQRYAAEGFVTVYANPRGSTGYGEAFAQLIDRAYPGDDYHDLMSVVDAVLARGYVDQERLYVTGGSGGGVLTAWIIGKTDRFAAAAAIKPVINWTTMALAGDIGAYVVRHWMRAAPWEEPELYWRLSPISLVGSVTTPTLVMVGEEDWRTPTWEAEQLYGALKLQEVPSALVRIPGAAHAIAARPSHLIAKTDNILGWFRRYDGGTEAADPQTE